MRLTSVFVGVTLFLGACSTVQNTSQQDLVWSAYNQCVAEGRVPTNIQLVRVEPDGRAWYSAYSSTYGAQELERCIKEQTSSSSVSMPPSVYALNLAR